MEPRPRVKTLGNALNAISAETLEVPSLHVQNDQKRSQTYSSKYQDYFF